MPARPATPSTSPGCSDKDALRKRPADMSRTVSTGSTIRSTGGFGGKVLSSERPMICSITSSSEISSMPNVPTLQPLRRMVRLSQNMRTSGMRCVMKMIVVPHAFCWAMICQPRDVFTRQRRGRFVEQQHLGLAQHRLDDFDLLAQRQIQRAHLGPRRDHVQAHLLQAGCNTLLRRLLVEQTGKAGRLVGQQQVLRHAEIRNQGEFLEGCLHAQPVRIARAAHAHLFAEQADHAAVRANQAAEDLDGGGLSRPVFPQKRMHLPGSDAVRHAFERHGRPEGLAYRSDADSLS